jgi:hypothetical protein
VIGRILTATVSSAFPHYVTEDVVDLFNDAGIKLRNELMERLVTAMGHSISITYPGQKHGAAGGANRDNIWCKDHDLSRGEISYDIPQ